MNATNPLVLHQSIRFKLMLGFGLFVILLFGTMLISWLTLDRV